MNPGTAAPPGLVVFLGNPGEEYRETRHNFAWRIPPFLDPEPGPWKQRFHGETCRYSGQSGSVWLLKPLTLMNRSGKSVAATAGYFRIPPGEILVVHDDLETDFGWIALKRGGGLGGHNGLRSIAESLGTRDFPRLRLGISRPGRGSVTSWVLGRFSRDERPGLDDIADAAAVAISRFIADGIPGMDMPRSRIYPRSTS